jgi:CRP-like cAMP-binding protein/tRNA A-37 threonylcarbamoyl transferase component Bud32
MNNAAPAEIVAAFKDRFEALERIGEGGMGEVFRGHDLFRDRVVAVKISRKRQNVQGWDARHEKLWLNEMRLAGKLRHPGIVEIFEAGANEDFSFIVMEYVAGGTLRPFTEPENLLPPERIADIIFRAASALDYATTEGLLHRDVKPANILLDGEGAPHVSDFGSAYILTSDETQISDVGTLPYMPPEHFSGKAPGVQTDIYALGITAYQLLTGAYPFQGATPSSMIYHKMNGEDAPVASRRQGVPEGFAATIHRAIERDQDKRFVRWQDFLAALAEALPQKGAAKVVLPESARYELFRRIGFFSDFAEAELWEAARIGTVRDLAEGETLFAEGSRESALFLVERGELVVTRKGTPLNRVGAGDCIGEMAYIYEANPVRSASVHAASEAGLIAFQPTALRGASERLQAAFAKAFMRVLADRLKQANDRFLALARTVSKSDKPR